MKKQYQLLSVGSNYKLSKGNKYIVAGLSLAPAKTVEGINLCPMAVTAGCDEDCLFTAGRGNMKIVQNARIRKTIYYRDNKKAFIQMLKWDIDSFIRDAKRWGVVPAIRLNVISDINWINVIKEYPNVQFYDYTKVCNRAFKDIPPNYHLTFSYSGKKEYKKHIDSVLCKTKHNVAVVFKGDFPKTFKGRKVISGDDTDFRFLDEPNVVVGLTAKGKARKSNEPFIIDTALISE